MFLEDLVKAANDLFAIFWTVVIVLLPFILILGWIIQWFES
jgi:cell division protein FtsX